MEIVLAESLGFCMGVKRVVDMAYRAQSSNAPVRPHRVRRDDRRGRGQPAACQVTSPTGVDRGLPFPVEDIARANVERFFGGAHPAWSITVGSSPQSDSN